MCVRARVRAWAGGTVMRWCVTVRLYLSVHCVQVTIGRVPGIARLLAVQERQSDETRAARAEHDRLEAARAL